MLNKIKEFQRDASRLNRNANSIEEFKMWLNTKVANSLEEVSEEYNNMSIRERADVLGTQVEMEDLEITDEDKYFAAIDEMAKLKFEELTLKIQSWVADAF